MNVSTAILQKIRQELLTCVIKRILSINKNAISAHSIVKRVFLLVFNILSTFDDVSLK